MNNKKIFKKRKNIKTAATHVKLCKFIDYAAAYVAYPFYESGYI